MEDSLFWGFEQVWVGIHFSFEKFDFGHRHNTMHTHTFALSKTAITKNTYPYTHTNLFTSSFLFSSAFSLFFKAKRANYTYLSFKHCFAWRFHFNFINFFLFWLDFFFAVVAFSPLLFARFTKLQPKHEHKSNKWHSQR